MPLAVPFISFKGSPVGGGQRWGGPLDTAVMQQAGVREAGGFWTGGQENLLTGPSAQAQEDSKGSGRSK